MSVLVYNDSARCLPWACERIGIGSFRSDAQSIGLERDGELVAVCVFDTFSERDCSMHIASDGSKRWMTRAFLIHCFAYPFITCKLPRVSSHIAESNKASIRLNLKLGFRVEGVHPHAAKDGAMISTGLMRESCVFLPKTERHMRQD